MYFKRLVSFQMHTNRVFNGQRWIETSTQNLLHPEEGYYQKIWVGGVRPASQDPYPIYDQILRYWSLFYLWPDQKIRSERYIKILFQTCLIIESLVQTNVKLP